MIEIVELLGWLLWWKFALGGIDRTAKLMHRGILWRGQRRVEAGGMDRRMRVVV